MGALEHCTRLRLTGNAIGDAGLISLSSALAEGALPVCHTIQMAGNPASDEAKQAVKDALASRSN